MENTTTHVSGQVVNTEGALKVVYLILVTLVVVKVTQVLYALYGLIAKRIREDEALKVFPGPPLHWLLGIFDKFPPAEKVLDYTLGWNKYGSVARVRVGPFRNSIRLQHPDFLECMMKTSEPKDSFAYRFLKPWIGDGLLISSGQKWARNRRLLTPAFHFDILKPYTDIFDNCASIMTEKWKRLTKGGTVSVEIFEHVSLMTLDSVLKCIFSYHGDCQNEGFKNPYIKAVYDLADITVKRFRFLPYHVPLIFKLSPLGSRFRKACNVVHAYSGAVIAKRKEFKRERKSTSDDIFVGKKKLVDFLDVLLDAKDEDGKGLTDTEIQHEVDTFMFEGHDTTASGISWCLYNLARHPEYQQKCRDEINEILEQRTQMTWNDLSGCEYLTMCIKESLRLHPPVPFISRELTQPLTLPDGRVVPKGMVVTLPLYCVLHNSEVWPNAEVYDPQRFTAENSKGRSPFAFIPFSAGPRNCIGQHFAMNEMKVAIAKVLKNFYLEVDESAPAIKISELVLRAKGGLRLKIRPVNPRTPPEGNCGSPTPKLTE